MNVSRQRPHPHTVEPVFGDHKENRGWRRFRRHGLSAARSEWALMNLSHNIAKLVEYHATPPPHPPEPNPAPASPPDPSRRSPSTSIAKVSIPPKRGGMDYEE